MKSCSFDSSAIHRVQSNDLADLGLHPGDAFRILPLPYSALFEGDLVAAIVNGFRCMGRLRPGRHSLEVELVASPQRVYLTNPQSIIGLIEREQQFGQPAPRADH